jgi:hypothetical protein
MDPIYHSGRADIDGFDATYSFQYHQYRMDIEKAVSVTMFAGKEVRITLYKMAIYAEGGHFDWHTDPTSSENHQHHLGWR